VIVRLRSFSATSFAARALAVVWPGGASAAPAPSIPVAAGGGGSFWDDGRLFRDDLVKRRDDDDLLLLVLL